MRPTLVSLVLAQGAAAALDVDVTKPDSIRRGAKQVADNLLTYYKGTESGEIPGILPGPPPQGDYYWWEGAVLWATLIDYWHYTGDSAYNDLTKQGILFQSGDGQIEHAFMPPNWTASMGNDDQGLWAMTSLLAAETKFADPPAGQPGWLALAAGAAGDMAERWADETACKGGLRWQIPFANIGYDYKNSLANGVFFNLAARLGRATGNATYAAWANQVWDWATGVGYLDADFNVYDGAHVDENCTDINKSQFSVNAGVFLQGAAFMFNQTTGPAQDQWRARVQGLLDQTLSVFFPDSGVPVEAACELPTKITCVTDMLVYKGMLLRWMTSAATVAPFARDKTLPVLKSAAAAAVQSCDGAKCGFRWTQGKYDGSTGAGQQMNALAALSGLLIDEAGVSGPAGTGPGGAQQTGKPNLGSLVGVDAWVVLAAVGMGLWGLF